MHNFVKYIIAFIAVINCLKMEFLDEQKYCDTVDAQFDNNY